MSVEYFVDTNILVYAVSGAPHEAKKRERANEILGAAKFGLSAQVLQEFFVTVVKKTKLNAPAEQALTWLEQFDQAPCVPIDFDLVRTAIGHSDRFKISYWDGAIIAAANELGCHTLYTEDLNHDQSYGAVKVINPFI